jgi:hypothetical protein
MSLELCTLKASITSQVVTIAGDRRRVEVEMRFIPSAGETCPHAKPGVSLSEMYVF